MKRLFIVIILFNITLITINSQQIKSLKYQYDGFYDYIIYPLGPDEKTDFGFYQISIYDNFYQDKTVESLQNKVSYDLLRNTMKYYHAHKRFRTSSIINGVIGFSVTGLSAIPFGLIQVQAWLGAIYGGLTLGMGLSTIIVFFTQAYYAHKYKIKYLEGEKKIIHELNTIESSNLKIKFDLMIMTS